MMEPSLLESCVDEPQMTCVCCHCQRERTENNEWRDRCPVAGERITHGICPCCLYELYPDIAPLIQPCQSVPAFT
jgi:hypothetical protein